MPISPSSRPAWSLSTRWDTSLPSKDSYPEAFIQPGAVSSLSSSSL